MVESTVESESMVSKVWNNTFGRELSLWFTPNHMLAPRSLQIMIVFQILFLMGLWLQSSFVIMPSPLEVMHAWQTMITDKKLFYHLFKISYVVMFEAAIISLAISVACAYLASIPFFRTIAHAVSALRFLSMVGLMFMFEVCISGSHHIKVSLLAFGMSVFLVPAMVAESLNVSEGRRNYLRTLGMSEWRIAGEIMLGKTDMLWDAFRQNLAMGFMMITLVEGVSRDEGGVGVLLLNENRGLLLAGIFAIQLTIFTLGIVQDFILGYIGNKIAPFAVLSKEKKS